MFKLERSHKRRERKTRHDKAFLYSGENRNDQEMAQKDQSNQRERVRKPKVKIRGKQKDIATCSNRGPATAKPRWQPFCRSQGANQKFTVARGLSQVCEPFTSRLSNPPGQQLLSQQLSFTGRRKPGKTRTRVGRREEDNTSLKPAGPQNKRKLTRKIAKVAEKTLDCTAFCRKDREKKPFFCSLILIKSDRRGKVRRGEKEEKRIATCHLHSGKASFFVSPGGPPSVRNKARTSLSTDQSLLQTREGKDKVIREQERRGGVGS